ncbi:hypothetical protein JR316_0004351 [Psilocybe cubensis]|uniref:Uncharacterized protein n=1 Tax=Psilocybe cubensis TaxID=181762 RepID=A0ACB8H2N2_PSICU|nr:hypothetical protein JR316_0004351 [Psilocybe cubensis]KAH9482253.1 hypothetical protein JR316_0004351 [Psilocybe cubensis]
MRQSSQLLYPSFPVSDSFDVVATSVARFPNPAFAMPDPKANVSSIPIFRIDSVPGSEESNTRNGTGSITPASMPATPGERSDDEGFQFTPKRAMASFENLVAMANHQERLKEARKMVWRDRGQPVVELDTLEACLAHAMSGGIRSATLAFNIRALLNLVLALIRIHRVPRDYRIAMIRQAVFGSDTWRFAAMLGSFTSLYKFLINALPILIPAIRPKQSTSGSALDDEDNELDVEAQTSLEVPLEKRKGRLSLTKRAQMVLIRKQTRRWHAALAGAVAGGLAIMWEKRSRRGVIAQQLFVRGLQGSYNAFTTKRGLHVPHGDVLVFSLACGQIVYAFLLRPDTLPRSYRSWMSQASKVPAECVRMNHDMVREGVFDLKDLEQLIRRPDITAANKADLLSLRTRFLNPLLSADGAVDYFPRYGPCSAVHPALSSCSSVPVDRFFAVFKWMLPIYGALHFFPAVLFKRKSFVQDPGKVLLKATLGSLRSSAFLGAFVAVYQTIYCYKHKIHKFLTLLRNGAIPASLLTSPLAKIPQWIIDLLVSKVSFWLPGFIGGLALFVEEKRRRGELAMYVLPKGLESAWVMARGKGYVFRTGKWGETLLTAIGMAMVMVGKLFGIPLMIRPLTFLVAEHVSKRPPASFWVGPKSDVSVHWAELANGTRKHLFDDARTRYEAR